MTRKSPAQPEVKKNIDLIEEVNYRNKLAFIPFRVRSLCIAIALLCSYGLRYVIGSDLPAGLFIVLYMGLATNAVYLLIFKFKPCKQNNSIDNLHFSYYLPGVFYATLAAHFFGGAEWIGYSFYFLDLVCANMLLRRWRKYIVTALIIFSYIVMVCLEYRGIVGHYKLFVPGDNLRFFITVTVLVQAIVFFAVSYSTGLFTKLRHRRERWIRESRNRFEAKSFRLESMVKDLNARAAESQYIKEASSGYVEAKEYELENTKKDLEEQIDNLRRTQKSMVFMIEDLNEMSVQLRDARDHLEEKVRERTDELLSTSRKLHRSERLAFLGKLAGSVTHELRNPLAVLKNAVFFLGMKFKENSDEKVTKYVVMMKKELSFINSIIDDIMGFARTKAPLLRDTDVKDVVENALSTINVPDLIEVRKEYESDLPLVRIDSNQFMHAVVNITNNAIMAMSGNGILTLGVKKQGNTVCVEVGDTGSGIPPEEKDLIFEPLYTSKPKGTGLGLPISKMMIENQGGKIEFESQSGRGTVFKIFLPMRGEEIV